MCIARGCNKHRCVDFTGVILSGFACREAEASIAEEHQTIAHQEFMGEVVGAPRSDS